jgi:hypothetical protein
MKMANFRQGKVVWPEELGVGKPSSLTSNSELFLPSFLMTAA